jgi:hypothetical protein
MSNHLSVLDSAAILQFCLLMSFVFMWILQIDDPENVIQRDRYGGGSVMIWGKMGHYGKTNLVKINGTPNSHPLIVRQCCATLELGSSYHISTR